MKTRPAPTPTPLRSSGRPPLRPRRRALPLVLGGLVLVALGVAAAVIFWSGATLEADPAALAAVHLQPLGGKLVRARAFHADGRPVPLTVEHGRLTPRTPVSPGERIVVDVIVRRPSALSWALGRRRHERLTVHAPVAAPTVRWMRVRAGAPVRVRFDRPVARFAFRGREQRLARPGATVSLGRQGPGGSVAIAAAARPWERVGRPRRVTWFPRTGGTVAVSSPAPGAKASPAEPLHLTFSSPVGGARPALFPHVPGRWSKPDSHTLIFRPSGFGAGFGSTIHVRLPRAVALAGPTGRNLHRTREITWHVPPGSTLRLHQLLAEAGYLPVTWRASGGAPARTRAAQVRAAVDPPKGVFRWRYANTPGELKGMWSPDRRSAITRGAVMKFQNEHGLDVDAAPGPAVWRALMTDAIRGRRSHGGYSYVYVHRDSSPQSMTLWHNGRTVIRSPGNTGVASAPTELGSFPVFEHLPVTTMSGTNPDGSHYNDPGIKWVSYFNGGDALHAFNRASFGSPQSVGCVELPEAAARKIFPYTVIGTVVTIES